MSYKNNTKVKFLTEIVKKYIINYDNFTIIGGVVYLANIKIKNEILETMLYIWDSVAQKQKITDNFLIKLAEHEDMKYLYGDGFDKESVRKVLSAISNRELLNNPTKKESKFWNNNMWMTEDLGFTNMMVNPVKTLNLDELRDKLSKEEYQVIFIPGHTDEYYIDENKLIINFFKIVVSLFDENDIKIGDKSFKEYIEENLLNI